MDEVRRDRPLKTLQRR